MTPTTAPATIDPVAARRAFENAPGLRRDEHHRYFYGSTGPLPSVTTIIKSLDRSGPLIGWAKRETAAAAVRNLDMLAEMVKTGGKEHAQKWLSGIPDYQRDTAADLGSRIHAIADEINRGVVPQGLITPELDARPYITAYQRFLAHMNPRFILSEAMVCNLTDHYGGSLDSAVAVEFPGENVPALLDIKTGRGVYPETALQFSGYANAEFTATPDDPTQHPLPDFKRFGVVHLQPDGTWTLVPYEVGDPEWSAFLACLALHRWTKDNAPWVKGRPYQEDPQP